MYTAVTGLAAYSAGMQTISNNIANVNTTGFKAGRTNYEDLISQNYYSGSSFNQRGTGVKVSSVQSIFSQGSFISSGHDTDMAIAGSGFFAVRNGVTNTINYTRAGVFELNADGYLTDPSGNILQGWVMSNPAPGEDPERIGSLTDVKITTLNAPPLETSQMKLAINLNADDEAVYLYHEHEMAHAYADNQAVGLAESARTAAVEAFWDPANYTQAAINPDPNVTAVSATVWDDPQGVSTITGAIYDGQKHPAYAEYFINTFNERYGANVPTTPDPVAILESDDRFQIVTNGVDLLSNPDDRFPGAPADRSYGLLTISEFNALATIAAEECAAEAERRGQDAYDTTYNNVYEATYSAIESRLTDWQLEGNGFAGAWNAQETPYISDENYTYQETFTIYDSLGNSHNMYTYFQANPHMENVWDYIITCDPLEDARKDSNNQLLMNDTASFSGLIQKGKITFNADGVIKDIEAQNLDLTKTKMATLDPATYTSVTSSHLRDAKVGGYFTGSPTINPITGLYESSARNYTVTWAGNVSNDPLTSGFNWVDDAGNSGIIPIYDRNTVGPYEFGSGMTITFDTLDTPLNFVVGDQMSVTAHSEQMGWVNLTPNEEGYFDFDVAFVQSASLALHPPYPEGMPTIIQNIALDLGASNPNGLAEEWKLDDTSTTQYASKSSTVFSSQDGFPAGSLQRVSIGEDGVITGVYTNSRQQALYQVGLAYFINPNGLEKLGDNLFAETRYSGNAAINEPGVAGTGTILGNFLEQSNVDLAEEIVNMITTQRAFQANSKTVTTVDTMMAEVLEMKR